MSRGFDTLWDLCGNAANGWLLHVMSTKVHKLPPDPSALSPSQLREILGWVGRAEDALTIIN